MKINEYQTRAIVSLARWFPDLFPVQAGLDVINALQETVPVLYLSGLSDAGGELANCEYELHVGFDANDDVRFINRQVSRLTAWAAHTMFHESADGDELYIGLPSWNVRTQIQGLDINSKRLMFIVSWRVEGLELDFDFEEREVPVKLTRLIAILNEEDWDGAEVVTPPRE